MINEKALALNHNMNTTAAKSLALGRHAPDRILKLSVITTVGMIPH